MTVDYTARLSEAQLLPVDFIAPPASPLGFGLYAAIGQWQSDPENRFMSGVRIRGNNYGHLNSVGTATDYGVWADDWWSTTTSIDLSAATGPFTLTIGKDVVTDIATTASSEDLQTEINAVVGLGVVTVTGTSPNLTLSVVGDRLVSATENVHVTRHIKDGERSPYAPPYAPITIWAYDECDKTAGSQAEVVARSQQILSLKESFAVEEQFAHRLLLDGSEAPIVSSYTKIEDMFAQLDAAIATTGAQGFIHCGAQWASIAACKSNLLRVQNGRYVTALGNVVVFGAGYATSLLSTFVATSPVFGWRNAAQTTTAIDTDNWSSFSALTERTVCIGYEHFIASASLNYS